MILKKRRQWHWFRYGFRRSCLHRQQLNNDVMIHQYQHDILFVGVLRGRLTVRGERCDWL